jgi:hypothetical protein
MIIEYSEMDDVCESNGIAPKTWFGANGGEKSYYVLVWEWNYARQVIERDGLICFQVTVHCQDCYTCKERIAFVKQQLADQNVQCFWTHEPDNPSLYVTVGPPPEGVSAEAYLSHLLQWPVISKSRLEKGRSKRRKTKAGSRNRRHIVQ